jgi:hypothetical protein
MRVREINVRIVHPEPGAVNYEIDFDAANKERKRSAKANNELQADPAHPPTVQGRDSGRAQGEAAGEGKSEKGKT